MFKKLIKGVIFREICCQFKSEFPDEFNKDTIEILTYIDEVTGGVKDNIQALKKLSLWSEIGLLLLCKIRPVARNILKLCRDEEFRFEWYARYEFFRDTLINLKIYPAP